MIVVHDGKTIPTLDPKDPNSEIWIGFKLKGLQDGDVITSYSFLINDQEVTTPGDEVDGLTYQGKDANGTDTAKVLLHAGTEFNEYKLTLRFSTPSIPSDDRSATFMVRQL